MYCAMSASKTGIIWLWKANYYFRIFRYMCLVSLGHLIFRQILKRMNISTTITTGCSVEIIIKNWNKKCEKKFQSSFYMQRHTFYLFIYIVPDIPVQYPHNAQMISKDVQNCAHMHNDALWCYKIATKLHRHPLMMLTQTWWINFLLCTYDIYVQRRTQMKTIFHLQFCCYSSTLTRIVIGQFFQYFFLIVCTGLGVFFLFFLCMHSLVHFCFIFNIKYFSHYGYYFECVHEKWINKSELTIWIM